ncbi:hypothetical protein M3P05_04260 [Sansalvadorimonas sp. 2012CJ34-2]|uniref:Transposase n=1 Tax=Parendozoicomonas callyspongiae TaxID=2942213 RepID=A0ABT0PDP6_9GAMM|nr:hypothetical protein [Sansalvadorimonas sp. 2012CJ34-2]MCL6269156.1 hypothetical protein [Sansalvadorimonas sp. 2012CJ34-2]
MPVKYHIRLSAEEQLSLKALVKSKAARHKRFEKVQSASLMERNRPSSLL